MKSKAFIEKIRALGIQTFIGVPDSTLKEFCDYIRNETNDNRNHVVPANEGAAIGLAMGTYLSTGIPACVYMQNSGLGNMVNPVTSLANEAVYAVPMLIVVGFRGEPGVQDEPQHTFMGQVTEVLLELMHIPYEVVGEHTTPQALDEIFQKAEEVLAHKKQFAIVAKKNSFEKERFLPNQNEYSLVREEVIGKIIQSISPEDVIISTTGKISREVYEMSDQLLGNHEQSFLTVGGMGHAIMIALGMAEHTPSKKVYCIDGDGAVLMHMGNLAIVGNRKPDNLIHICLNNDAHESVGGMPTGAVGLSMAGVAKASGYQTVYTVMKEDQLPDTMQQIQTAQ